MIPQRPARRSSPLQSFQPPRTPNGSDASLKATQQQYDWEREIESLDKKEMEVHQSQMKLIREQMTTFLRDLAGLREEVGVLLAFREEVAKDKMESREELMALLEGVQQDLHGHRSELQGVSSIVGELSDKHGQLEGLHGRVAAFEAHGSRLGELHEVHATLDERVQLLEQLLGESGEQQAKDLEALRAMHDSHAAGFHQHAKDLAELRSSIPERLNYLEKIVGDSADEHNAKLEATLAKLDHFHGRLSSCETQGSQLGKLHGSLASEKNGLMANHATLSERVDYLEAQIGDSADKHEQELASLRSSHDKHLAAFSKHSKAWDDHRGELHGHHHTVAERLGELEQALGTYADKHDDHSADMISRFESVHGRVAGCERLGGQLDELRRMHSGLAKEKQELAGHHTILKDRLDGFDRAFGDSIDEQAGHLNGFRAAHDKHQAAFARHVKEFEVLRSEKNSQHSALAERLASIELLHGDTADRHTAGLSQAHTKMQSIHERVIACERFGSTLNNLQRSHDALAERKADLEAGHATVQERLDYLEQKLGDSADKHSREIGSLRDAHSKHGSDLDNLKALHKRASTVDERLVFLEKSIGDSADKHSEEFAELRRAHDQFHGRLGACENHGSVLSELQRAHGSLASEKELLHTHHATLQERVAYLEDLMNDSADQHSQKLDAAHSKLDEMHGRVAVCEKFGPALNDLKRSHSDFVTATSSFQSDHGGMRDRLDNMEAAFGDAANRQTKDIAGLKQSNASNATMLQKHAGHIDSLNTHKESHATLPERVGYLEQQIGDSADKHAAEVEELHKKVAREQQAREKHHGSFKDILAREKEERANHHATLTERLTYVEGMLGDNADKHERELQQLAATHQKLSNDVKERGQHHGTLAERVNDLEASVVELGDRQAKDAKAAQNKFDHMSTRFSIIKGAWSQETPRLP